jgi:hypothetical protein
MIIQTSKFKRNYLLTSKNGFKLYELNSKKINNHQNPNKSAQKLTISTQWISKSNQIIDVDKEDSKIPQKTNSNYSNYLTYANSTMKSNMSKLLPKIKEYKKRFYLHNVLSTEKNYLLEDYMKKKELKLMHNKNIKTIYDAKKTFFNEDKIDDDRTSFYCKEKSFDKTNKYHLMIKDIQSNFVLLKNKNKNKYKQYHLLNKIINEKQNFKDFNEKFGMRNIYIKTDKILNKNKTFMNNNFTFVNFMKYLNAIRLKNKKNKTSFSQKRINTKSK